MPPPRATAVFSSRLLDGDPSQRYMDLFIALSVLEKLEVSYTKSLLSMEEYEKELAAGIKQARKAHRLISHEFATIEDFAKVFGRILDHAEGKRETHEFQRAIMQLEGGNDLIGIGQRSGSATQGEAIGDFGTVVAAEKADKADQMENQAAKPGALMAIWDAIQVIKELVDAYEEDGKVKAARVRECVKDLVACLGQLDERALADMAEDVERIRGWESRLAGMESRRLIDSKSLVDACDKLKLSMKRIYMGERSERVKRSE
jgi:hypothetical protein